MILVANKRWRQGDWLMMETDVNEEEEILFMNALYLKVDGESAY